MKIKLTENGEDRIFYSADVIENIKSIVDELLETYPESAEFCIRIFEVINGKTT